MRLLPGLTIGVAPLATANIFNDPNKILFSLPREPYDVNDDAAVLTMRRVGFPGINRRWEFSCYVEQTQMAESFVWRHSKSDLAREWTGGREKKAGLLCRQGTTSPDPRYSADDGAVVATAVEDDFLYLGLGATGALGQRWAIAAAFSALAIFEKGRRKHQGVDLPEYDFT
jgi:hypothetical protein